MADKSERAEREEKILKFWQENKIFEKSLEKGGKEFVFYEGPPTANGRPGIHHIEARSFKDAIPRYKTMQDFRVARKGGWDTHGLPVELEVEKQLGLKSKKEIEAYGIAKFNEECKKSVWKYVDEWHDFTRRIGFWVDLENPYVTYHNSYIEAVWSVLSKVEKRKLLYRDYKVLPWCPRCGTALSSHELAQGYQDVKDISLYVKFKLKNPETLGLRGNVYMVAWTTTPWTLPGNVALAVGNDIEYLVLRKNNDEAILVSRRTFIHKKELFEGCLIQAGFSAEREKNKLEGKDLVGLEYEPLYEFAPKNENSHKVYAADFVTTEDGTGIVHTAVMYGQDDFQLGTQVGLPKEHLIDEAGNFKQETEFLSGKSVVEESTAVEILKDLQNRGLLFDKESYTHSYPFCWRCKTRLIYYARDSWYIAMSKLRDELISENKKINWVPEYIKDGRFGEWLKEVKDWAISRERYWGTPLPIWHNANGSKRIVVDSLETLKKYAKKSGNKYFVMRHGEAESNAKKVLDLTGDPNNHVTEKGKEEVKKVDGKRFDLIFSSPFLRAKETAELLTKDFKTDERLREAGPQEEPIEIRRRVGEFIFELENKYKDKKILIISHGEPIWWLLGAAKGEAGEFNDREMLKTGEVRELEFVPYPRNANFELDLHRPYIDEVVLEKDGEEYKRVKEVMDVWFDSGAMPFAQDPGNVKFPADYISEAIDQTRGWFYTLHAIGILMEKGMAYKNVVCLGHILDKEGKKMSKSVGNVINPWEMIDKYGVDVLRLWMYSVNQPGESKNFDERTVDELQKRIFNLLDNVYAFYELYRDKELEKENISPENILDKWILARLNQLIEKITENLDNYKLLEPVRELRDFIDDLSTWYLRRSRERLKAGDKNAKETLYFILKQVSKLLSPFAPFAAEDLYQKLKTVNDPESVHLAKWPEAKKNGLFGMFGKRENVLEDMSETRRIVSLALEARQKAKIPVRHPSRELRIKNNKLGKEYLEIIIKEEVNVKSVVVDANMEFELELDTLMTPELIEEGKVRDAIRTIQDWRKEKGLKSGEKASYKTDDEFYLKHKEEIEKVTNVELSHLHN